MRLPNSSSPSSMRGLMVLLWQPRARLVLQLLLGSGLQLAAPVAVL
jgi:hypothetical protein